MQCTRTRRLGTVVLALAVPLTLAACGPGEGETRTLRLAHSYTGTQPQTTCGAEVIEEVVDAADVGLDIEVYGSSQLGGDADRIPAVVSGDIDIDIQGASALGAVYGPLGIIDGAYVFEDGQQLSDFISGDASQEMRDAFKEVSGVTILGAWSAGARHFTANTPIREPEDLSGLRMRFPNSAQFLMNARALGARPTEVAYEEIYLALQQGLVDGQENPIVNIDSSNLAEVQDYLSLSGHQLNSNLIVIGPDWDELTPEQQEVLQGAVDEAVAQVSECVAQTEEAVLQEWRSGGDMEVVDDVDVEAFRSRTVDYFDENLSGDTLELYRQIQEFVSGE